MIYTHWNILQSFKQLVISRFSWHRTNEQGLEEKTHWIYIMMSCFLKGEGEGKKGALGEAFLLTPENGAQPHLDP